MSGVLPIENSENAAPAVDAAAAAIEVILSSMDGGYRLVHEDGTAAILDASNHRIHATDSMEDMLAWLRQPADVGAENDEASGGAPVGTRKNRAPQQPHSKVGRPQPGTADFQVHRPDTALFATLQGLQMQSGVPINHLRRLVLKELVDNALDAADAAGRSGQVRIEQVGDNAYSVEDRGNGMAGNPGEIASLVSLGRMMISSKFWRLPSRGCLGNGLRIIVGTVAATGGTIEITTRNRRMLLRPLKSGKTEIVSTDEVNHPVGTRLAVKFGSELPADPEHLSWAQSAIALAQKAGPAYSRAANPHWFDADQFAETLSIIEPPETTIRQFVERMDGCAGARAGQMVSQFGKGRTCRSMTEVDARELLVVLQANARVVKAGALGPIGEDAFNPELYGYSQKGGTFTFGTHAPLATIPFIIEAWVHVANRKGDDVSVSCQCNRTPIVGKIEAYRRRHDTKSISLGGVGLDLTSSESITLPRGDCDIHLHITSPLIPTSSIGKRPNLSCFSDEIAGAIRQAFTRSRNRLPSDPAEPKPEKIKPLKPPSHKSIVLDHLFEAIDLTSGNGEYIFGQRNLFYKVRPFVEQETGGEVLTYANFTQIITAYESEHGDIQGMIRDDRGSFFDLVNEIPLGTTAVAIYRRPSWRFHKVLYCEKEDHKKILQQAGWDNRHDCAVMSSKGYPSRAARDLIDKIADTVGNEPVTVFCLHDADAAGSMIAQTLQEATLARGRRRIEIIDLGLYPQQAIDMGLPIEDILYDRPQPVSDYITNQPGNWYAWLQHHRIELNALSPSELMEFLDEQIEQHGELKVVPPAVYIANYITDNIRNTILEQERERVLREAEVAIQKAADDRTSAVIPHIAQADELQELIRTTVTDDRETHWTEAVEELANSLIDKHGGSINMEEQNDER